MSQSLDSSQNRLSATPDTTEHGGHDISRAIEIGQNADKPDRLARMMDSAEILITYACRNAVKPIDIEENNFQAIIEEIIVQQEKYKRESLSPEEEAKFLNNFRRLTRALHPVTVGSIQDSVWEKGMPNARLFFMHRLSISRADATIARFSVLSIAALVSLLFFQIFWVYGYTLVEQITNLSRRPGSKTEQIANNQGPTTPPAKESGHSVTERSPNGTTTVKERVTQPDPENLPAADLVDQTKPIATQMVPAATEAEQIALLNDSLQRIAAFDLLIDWWDWWPGTLRPDDTLKGEQKLASNNSILISSTSFVKILDRYFLPLLYGLVGACTYVLREVVREMRTRVFRAESEISYWVRILLGMLAGLAIGWISHSDASVAGQTAPGSESALARLAPSALSFVAGYSVELLFSAMDRVILAFGATSQQSKS